MKPQYKKLPKDFYELDGLTQLLTCKCEDCIDILKTQNTWELTDNWDPNEAVNQMRPYKGNLVGYSYQESPHELRIQGISEPIAKTKWVLHISPAGESQ